MQVHLGHPAVDVGPSQPQNHYRVPAPPPLNDLRRKIQERLHLLEIKACEIRREQLELRSRWNCSLTVTQLPNEILFNIFVYFSEPPQRSSEKGGEDDEIPGFGLAKLGWTKLMLVCHRWYDVARATPVLWRTIDVGKNHSWAELALSQSGDATIDVSFPSRFDKTHASLLWPHCHRVRSLRLRSWTPDACQVIHNNTFLALETLEVRDVTGQVQSLEDFGEELGIARERFPNLHTLRLAYTALPREPLFYARLRRLSLEGCIFKSSHEQFVQLLSQCSELEHLEIDHVLDRLSDGENVGTPRILPSLVSIRLDNHAPTSSAGFLSRIVAPLASLSVTAEGGIVGHDYDSLRDIVPLNFTHSFPRLPSVTWGKLTVIDEQCSIQCHPTKPGWDEVPLVELGLIREPGFDWEYHLSDGLADLLAIFGSAPLTHLELKGYSSNVGAKTWTRVFRAFPSLVSLKAYAEESLFAGLHEVTLASPADDTEPVACPGLEHLSLNDGWRLRADLRADLLLDPLIHCLRYRANRGIGLKELHIDCGVEVDVALQEYLPLLQGLVSNVVLKTT